jgi:hypothetical protein
MYIVWPLFLPISDVHSSYTTLTGQSFTNLDEVNDLHYKSGGNLSTIILSTFIFLLFSSGPKLLNTPLVPSGTGGSVGIQSLLDLCREFA